MGLITQRKASWNLRVGEADGSPAGWGQPALLTGGADFATDTCFPHFLSTPWNASLRAFYAHDQATAAADTSLDLNVALAGVAPIGIITAGWAVVRSPDGDTISAQWFIDGVATGSAITFSNTDHEIVLLPEFQYQLEDWLYDRTLTLRLWGGLAHISVIAFMTRPTATLNAIDIIDPASTIATVVSDSRSLSGGDVVEVATSASIGIGAAKEVLLIDPSPVLEERFWIIRMSRGVTPVETTGSFAGYATNVDNNDYHIYSYWLNGAQLDNSGGVGDNWDGILPESHARHLAWAPLIHAFGGHDLSQAQLFDWETLIDQFVLGATDTLSLRAWTTRSTAMSSRSDELVFCRAVEQMTLAAGLTSTYACDTTFDIDWFYEGPIVQGGAAVDRTSLFVGGVEGRLYAPDNTLVATEAAIGASWTVDLSVTSPGSGWKAFVVGTLDDGSYAYVGWEFNVTCEAGQIYRRF